MSDNDKNVLYRYKKDNILHITPNLQVAIKRTQDGTIGMFRNNILIDEIIIEHEKI